MRKIFTSFVAVMIAVAIATTSIVAENFITQSDLIVEPNAGDRIGYTDDDIVGGNIYYNPNTGYIVDSDKTISSVVIPSDIYGTKIIGIDKKAFYGRPLTNIVLPETLETIGESAFEETQLVSVIIPESVATLGKSSFGRTTALKDLSILGACDIGTNAFSNSGVVSANIPYVTQIGSCSFAGCASLENVVLENGCTKIGDGAFMNCVALKSIYFPPSLTTISIDAFRWSGLSGTLTIPRTITSIGYNSFTACVNLNEIIYLSPDDLGFDLYFSKHAFNSCDNVSKIVIGDAISKIVGSNFTGHGNQTVKVYLLKTIKEIEAGGFGYSNLEFYYEGCEGMWGNIKGTSDNFSKAPIHFYNSEDLTLKHKYQYYSDYETHWRECPDCGAKYGKPEPHTFVDGKCSVCGRSEAMPGDLNSSGGDPDVLDGVVMQRILASLEPEITAADLNHDGIVNVADGVVMQRILAGLE